ncbi:MAG: leucine--tRNA ligase [Acidilobus sp.]
MPLPSDVVDKLRPLSERLKEIEAKWQRVWEERHVYESDADPGKPKFFVTFPFPYMNGLPHIGSAFTILRVDIIARYKRMRGFNVLFPQGWHATGGPIVASARRLAEGDEKVRAELKAMGVPDDEIDQFKDPAKWVTYFTKEWEKDLRRYGLSIDWRRKFYTTSLNPYFSKFVEWQYLRLKDLGLVRKGSHPVVWCPREKKVVGDHDRPDDYVGIGPVEATIILFKLKDEDLSLATLTYRPETIFGVTNIWVRPDAIYYIVELDGKKVVMNDYMADELADQKHSVKRVGEVKGIDLVGRIAINPVNGSEVPVLPASFVIPDEGTGLVMSVPAHAPYDYQALVDLTRLQDDELAKMRLSPDLVKRLRPIKIIDVPDIRGVPAEEVVKRLKVKSQDDRDLLDKATKELYAKEFYSGVMSKGTGKYEGLKVMEARPLVEKDLIAAGAALKVYTLPSKVYCRCGARTHVKFVEDQWFLTYGDAQWKERAKAAVERMSFYPPELKAEFLKLVDWLRDWAFTHQNELGTPLPWDPTWVIESLSDSTIYMAYYTISHLIQGKVNPDQLKPEFFDYVLLGRGDPDSVSRATGLDRGLVEAARREFEYWYPVDMRISGKDLMQNHLLFFIYHHAALFDEDKWPRGIGINGWVLINGEKMSKHKGNFITLREVLDAAGADATRVAEVLAGADAGLDDANFNLNDLVSAANDLLSWIDAATELYGKGREGWLAIDSWFESKLNSVVKEVTNDMENQRFKSAFVKLFYGLQNSFKWYVRRAGSPNRELTRKFVEYVTLMLAPFAPHVAEETWHRIGKESLVVTERWPTFDESKIRPDVEKGEEIVERTLDDVKEVVTLLRGAKSVTIIVAAGWKYAVFSDLISLTSKGVPLRDAVREVMNRDYGVPKDQVAKVTQAVLRSPEVVNLFVERDLELRSLLESSEFLSRELGVPVRVEPEETSTAPRREQALPGKPAIYVER